MDPQHKTCDDGAEDGGVLSQTFLSPQCPRPHGIHEHSNGSRPAISDACEPELGGERLRSQRSHSKQCMSSLKKRTLDVGPGHDRANAWPVFDCFRDFPASESDESEASAWGSRVRLVSPWAAGAQSRTARASRRQKRKRSRAPQTTADELTNQKSRDAERYKRDANVLPHIPRHESEKSGISEQATIGPGLVKEVDILEAKAICSENEPLFDPDFPPSPSCSPPTSEDTCGQAASSHAQHDEAKQHTLASLIAYTEDSPILSDSDNGADDEPMLGLVHVGPAGDPSHSQVERPSTGFSVSPHFENAVADVRKEANISEEPSIDASQEILESEAQNQNIGTRTKSPFHVATFDYVCSEVLRRYQRILPAESIDLARLLLAGISANARSLFVRLYRRQPAWHRVSALQDAYKGVQVEGAIRELEHNGLLQSTRSAQSALRRPRRIRSIAQAILPYMTLGELREVCTVVGGGSRLRLQNRPHITSALAETLNDTQRIEENSARRKRKALRQTTIDGSSAPDNLARAILRQNRVCIPHAVIQQLHRIHFLFFFEEGHDSPNVILAEVGKRRFARYECVSTCDPFRNRTALEAYEVARSFELTISRDVEQKRWTSALANASIAEVEVEQYVRSRERGRVAVSEVCGQSSILPAVFRREDGLCDHAMPGETHQQLSHPFFRRYSAVWSYAVATWRSVHAQEALREYEGAIARLRLLLRSGLLPNRRGKFLDRLSINLMHVGREQESLDVILEALARTYIPASQTDVSGGGPPQLHRGEIEALTKRGLRLHRNLCRNKIAATPLKNATAKARRAARSKEIDLSSRPIVLARAIESLGYKIPVRTYVGRPPRQRPSRELRRSSLDGSGFSKPGLLPLRDNDNESESKNASVTREARTGGGKKRFRGIRATEAASQRTHDGDAEVDAIASSDEGSNNSQHNVFVEELALEWYEANGAWSGSHCEGSVVRFVWCLLFWECAIFAPVPDVFQTPFQISPWDLRTEAFYASRRDAVEARLHEIREMDVETLERVVRASYSNAAHKDVLAVGAAWDSFSEDDVACVAAGLGPSVVAHICELLCKDYSYWASGMPDLVLWKIEGPARPSSPKDEVDNEIINSAQQGVAHPGGSHSMLYSREQTPTVTGHPRCILVEVKSHNDRLSARQRAWLGELLESGACCEVFRVVDWEIRSMKAAATAARRSFDTASRGVSQDAPGMSSEVVHLSVLDIDGPDGASADAEDFASHCPAS